MDWDLTSYFPSFDDPSRAEFERTLSADLESAYLAAKAIGPLAGSNVEAWEQWVLNFEALMARFSHLSSYVHALVSADGNNPLFQDAEARLSLTGASFSKLEAQLSASIGSADESTFAGWVGRPRLATASYRLSRSRQQARHQMAPALEELAADLGTDGIEAWGRLYDGIMSSLTFRMEAPNREPELLPFSARRSLMEGSDRAVRQSAFSAGNRALEPWLPTLSRALNHIAGTRLTLCRHRGISHVLDVSTFDAGISRATLDALFTAVRRRLDVPRRVLRLKAKAQKTAAIAWYDLGAPLPVAPTPAVTWPQAVDKVRAAFERQYPSLAQFFSNAIASRWVDYSSRPGKRPGAFCTTSALSGESRVFMTFGGTLGDVSTLAHEMGHAFHGHVLRKTRPLASDYPMTLAESASIFAELILVHGLLAEESLTDEQRTGLLAALVNDAPIFLLDVHTRFEFERAFYEERSKGEVRAERLSELMHETQLDIFGDTLSADATDPHFWASKLHFFITGVSFYNYPYIFGYLLSRGLHAQFLREGPAFLPKYEEFLARSASEEPALLARSVLGCDLEQPEFWEQSICSVLGPLSELEARVTTSS